MTVIPASAVALIFAVTVGFVPPEAIGAVHTLNSVPSDAVKDVTST